MFKIKDSTHVFVCPTDTIYGLSARASDKEAVERIKNLKGREDTRFIILLAEVTDLQKFGIELNSRQEELLARVWPGPVTVAFDSLTGSGQAFRVPDYPELQEFIKDIGPIVSTSVNKHGEPPASSVGEARVIFGSEVDEYIDAGNLDGDPSTIIKILR